MLFKELALTLTNHVNNGYNIVYYIDYRLILLKALKLGYGASEIKPLKKIFLNENLKTSWTKNWLMLLVTQNLTQQEIFDKIFIYH